MSQVEKFKYSVSKNGAVVVALFAGELGFESASDLQNATREIFSDESTKLVAIDLSQVGNITMDAIPLFLQLQKTARDRRQELRLCGINEGLKEKLQKLGVIRYRELASNLREALLSMRPLSAHSPSSTPSAELGQEPPSKKSA